VTTLDDKMDTAAYLTPHSDIVALIALTHQTRIHNLITRANYETRRAVQDEENAFKGISEKSDRYSDLTVKRIREAVEPLVRGMFFVNEAKLTDPVRGTTTFAGDFEKTGVRDSKGRSLKDLDLKTRFLRYPLSYLIYSQAFDELPRPAKDVFYERAWTILSGGDAANYPNLSIEDRTAIREILQDTKPDFVRAAHK